MKLAIGYADDLKMPPKGKLSDQEIRLLTDWIKSGSAWPESATKKPSQVVAPNQEPQAIRYLTEKLLVYGTGRRLEATDRGEVDLVTTALDKSGNKMRDLIRQVVQSKIFLTK